VTLAVYWPLRNSYFINYSDPFYVTDNSHVTEGLSTSSARWALTTTYRNNWHPLTWLSLQLDDELYGLNPHGYHLTNLLLHTVNVILLFWVLRRMTGAVGPSALAAALFAIHPLHVESVAWVAERKDVLSTLFWMLTLWAYLRYVERPGVGRYACVALALALGLMAKPMLVTLPFVLLLLDFWPLRRFTSPWPRRFRSLVAEKMPLFALVGASCVITLIARGSDGAIRTLEEFPLSSRAANAVVACVTYLVQTVWPRDLALFYPYVDLSWSDWRVWGACVFLVGVTIGTIRQAGRRPFLLVGWLWYLGTLVPVIGLVQVGDQAHADRYTYVPLIGVFVIVAWSVAELAARGERSRRLALACTAVALVGCAVLTWMQVGYWRNSESLWSHTVAVTGPNAEAHFSLGAAYRDQGKLERAAEEFRLTLAINPNYALARPNLGWVLFALRKFDEARPEIDRVLQTYPDDADAHFQLGVIASMEDKHEEAMARFARVLEIRPDDSVAHLYMAIDLIKQKKYEDARRHLGEAARCDPQVRDTREFKDALKAANQTQ
jgi:Tfp pilus assembly protein PilF